ncbi:hypothetical protein ACS0TY_015202 [Phlomoides rotata]
MKNIAICYSEHAIKVSDSYCSGPSNTAHTSSQLITPSSIQNGVSCVYKVKHSSQKQFLIRFTWCNRSNRGFCFEISDILLSVPKFSKKFRILHRESGSEVFESSGLRIEAVWDLRRAKYESGPEPVSSFYVAILVHSEVSLILGDLQHELETKKRIPDLKLPEFSLISRSEYFSGNSVYSTRVKFSENGRYHDIVIKCCGEEHTTSLRNLMLSVYIDKKSVVQVKRLQWNFRGNQSIFLDGLLIDLMWDVHNWLFNPSSSGYGVFLFRTRKGLDSRLWLEDKNLEHNQHEKVGISFLICAGKNPD